MFKNTSLAAKGALANRLQRRTAGKIQNCRQGAPKWQRGSGKVSTPRFLGVLSNFRQISFLIRALLLWQKVATKKKKAGEKNRKIKEKRLMEIMATMSLPAVDHPIADRWNAAHSCQLPWYTITGPNCPALWYTHSRVEKILLSLCYFFGESNGDKNFTEKFNNYLYPLCTVFGSIPF